MRDGSASRLAMMVALSYTVTLVAFTVAASAEAPPRAGDIDPVRLRPAAASPHALARVYSGGRPLRSAAICRKSSAPLTSSMCSGLYALRGSKSLEPAQALDDEILQKLSDEEGREDSLAGADEALSFAMADEGLPCGCPSPACLKQELTVPMVSLRGGRGRREDHDEDELDYGT